MALAITVIQRIQTQIQQQMKPRNKFLIGLAAALITFGTLSATVGHSMRQHCGHHSHHGCEQHHGGWNNQHADTGSQEQ